MKTANYNLTTKQIHIMKIVLEGNGLVDGKFVPVDLDQLIERTSYAPTKEAMQFSIRFLAKKGMMVKAGLEKRRGRKRVLYLPTEEAFQVVGGNSDFQVAIYGKPLVFPRLGSVSKLTNVLEELKTEEPKVPSSDVFFLEEIEDVEAAAFL
jgi:hypothetical protein